MYKYNSKYFEYLISAKNVVRWKGKYSIGRDSAGISAGRAAVIYFILCSLEEDFSKKELKNKGKGACGLILRGVTAKDRGDMRYTTKNNPLVYNLKKDGEKILLDSFLEGLSDSLSPFFKECMDLYESNKIEGKLMRLSKKFDSYLFARREFVTYQNKMFEDSYRKTYNSLIQELCKVKLKSGEYLLNSIENQDNLYAFLEKNYDLDKEYRWDTFERVTERPEDDDAIHSFRVSAINLFLGALEKFKFNKKVDFYGLIMKPLFHDLQEIEIGDIIMPIKYSTPEMKKTIHFLEDEAAKEMVASLSEESVRKALEKHFINAKDDTLEGFLTDLSDKLDSLLFCVTKMNAGSIIFKESYKINLQIMQNQYTEESFKFFLAYILYDLIK